MLQALAVTPLVLSAAAILAGGSAAAQRPLLSPPSAMLPTIAKNTAAIVAGDLDGDGDLDAYTAAGEIYLNAGHASFVARRALGATSGLSGTATALADVDGDGDLDALTATRSGRNLLYLNDGTGTFTNATNRMPADSHDSRGVVAADFDGDGDVDAVFGNTGTFFGLDAQTRLYLNDGTGTFTDATQGRMPQDSDSTTSLAAGDVDGDGDVDVVVGNEHFGQVAQNRLYLNDGSGVFRDATATSMPPVNLRTFSVALGDADGDGDLDLFTGNSNRPNRFYRNDGAGVFAEVASSFSMRSESTASVQLGDVDGDGDLDALVANAIHPNRLFLNDGSGGFTQVGAPTFVEDEDPSQSAVLADFDGDGDTDIIIGNTGGDRLYLNDGSGAFADPDRTRIPADSATTSAVAAADLNGDHFVDVVLGHDFGERTRLYLNTGDGGFIDATDNLPFDNDFTDAVVLGDVDGDRDSDVLIANCCGQPMRLYLNNGLGVFSDATGTRLPSGTGSTQELVLGDLDGDRDPDVWYVNLGRNGVLINGGNGVFTNESNARLPPIGASTLTGALLDVDGDGDLDAFSGNTNFEQDRLYLNDGEGFFTDVTDTHLPVDSSFTFQSAVGDVDADGDADLMLGGGGSQTRLYLNDGSGVFQDATATNVPADGLTAMSLSLRDFDNDGDLDAFIGTLSGGDALYENDGAGVFRDASADLLESVSGNFATAAGDFDADGDVDLFVASSAQNSAYLNRLRQLEVRALPRIGRPLDFDLSGPEGGSWTLFAATAAVRLPTPFGALRLDPATIVAAGAGALDGNGHGGLGFVVPALPAAVGTTVYWQAVVGTPFALTNLEPTTFTGY